MKVYVDELPKSCKECPCCSEQDFAICSEYCEVLNEYISEIVESEQELKPKTCPLQSLADYTKQVRKEVCEEIRDIVKKLEKPTNNTDEKILSGEMIKVTQEQLIFLKKFIIKYDKITVEEYLEHNWWWEDYEKEDIEYWYKECPELMYIISPFLYYRLQKYYNEEALCAGWCGCVDLKQIYDYIKMRQKYNKEYFLE